MSPGSLISSSQMQASSRLCEKAVNQITSLLGLVVPLSPVRGTVELSPVFRIEGREVALVPLQMFAIPREALGALVASLADDRSRIQISNALDEVLTTAFG